MTSPKAVVLVSGGMDSATAGAVAREQGFELYALSFRYGQRHAAELDAAKRVVEWLGVRNHVVLDIDPRAGVEGRRLRGHTPLIALTKAEIVKLGQRLGVDYGLTWSCYDPTPSGTPCGRCDACLLREKGFREAGIEDPALSR